MSDRLVVGLVDAGFLRKSLGMHFGQSIELPDIDAEAVVRWFQTAGRRVRPGLLRTYWYDAQFHSSHHLHRTRQAEFDKLTSVPMLQLRLGKLESRSTAWHSPIKRALRRCNVDMEEFKKHFEFRDSYEQKGVDTLLVLDIVRFAQSDMYSSVILMAGDADFAESVRVVQDMGKEVIVAHPKGAGIAPSLLRLADETVEIGDTELRKMLTSKPGLEDEAFSEGLADG